MITLKQEGVRIEFSRGDKTVVQYAEDDVVDTVRQHGQRKELRCRQWDEQMQKQLCDTKLAGV